jgi:hypothetical protein
MQPPCMSWLYSYLRLLRTGYGNWSGEQSWFRGGGKAPLLETCTCRIAWVSALGNGEVGSLSPGPLARCPPDHLTRRQTRHLTSTETPHVPDAQREVFRYYEYVEGRKETPMSRSETHNNGKNIQYAGVGIPIGTALGFLFGMLLFDNMPLGAGAGAAIGLIVGAAIDAQQAKNKPGGP